MASLKLHHIYKVYSNGVKAVNDFNIDINDIVAAADLYNYATSYTLEMQLHVPA